MILTQFKEGYKCIAICYNCETLVDSTLKYRDMKSLWGFINILATVCNDCDKVIGILAQETEKIKKVKQEYYGREET